MLRIDDQRGEEGLEANGSEVGVIALGLFSWKRVCEVVCAWELGLEKLLKLDKSSNYRIRYFRIK